MKQSKLSKKHQIVSFKLAHTLSQQKNSEEAGNIAKDQNKLKDAASLYEKAADFLQRGGKSDRASALFVKAASVLDIKEKDRAIKLFKQALDIYSSNDSHHHAAEVYRAFNAFLIKERLYDEAVTNIEGQIISYGQLKQDHNKHKSMLAVLILRLKTGAWVKATEQFEKWCDSEAGFQYSDEGKLSQDLLDAYESNSEDQLKKVLKNSKIRLLENQIAKLALSLKLTDDMTVKTKTTTTVQKDQKKNDLLGSSDEEIDDKEPTETPGDNVFDDNDMR